LKSSSTINFFVLLQEKERINKMPTLGYRERMGSNNNRTSEGREENKKSSCSHTNKTGGYENLCGSEISD
jgi:hypothetical protein